MNLLKTERDFRELDMLCNIMIINMAYIEIEKFKLDKYMKYSKCLKEYAQHKVKSYYEVK